MSVLFDNKLSTSFAYNKVEAVLDFGVDALVRNHSAGAASQTSSNASTTARQTRRNIDRAETCFITKCPSYTLERAHWVNAVRKNANLKKKIEKFLSELGIVHDSFNLNDTSNLTNRKILDRMLHVSLDKYGFFAVTASLTTLQEIITLVEEQNRVWQEKFDRGRLYIRDFDLQSSPFSNALYELVVLHPEHFLPKGSSLTFYTTVNNQLYGKQYVVGQDRTIRESPGTSDCPRLPAFTFDANRAALSLNVFLVVLNAEIKFRRYRRMGTMSKLPENFEELMDKTIELVELIYWKPEKKTPYRQRVDLSLSAMDVDVRDIPDVEMGMKPIDEEEDEDTLGKSSRHTQVVKRPGTNATLEQRKEYMQYLLSGRDFELDSDDVELLEELGYGPDSSVMKPSVPDINTLDPIQAVRQWQQAIEVK